MKMMLIKMEMQMIVKLDKTKVKWMNLIKQNRAEEPYSQKYYSSSRFLIIGNQ